MEQTQQEESGHPGRRAATGPSQAERAARSRRRTLELSRAKAVADLARATTPAHREMLTRAIADLDAQLVRSRGAD